MSGMVNPGEFLLPEEVEYLQRRASIAQTLLAGLWPRTALHLLLVYGVLRKMAAPAFPFDGASKSWPSMMQGRKFPTAFMAGAHPLWRTTTYKGEPWGRVLYDQDAMFALNWIAPPGLVAVLEWPGRLGGMRQPPHVTVSVPMSTWGLLHLTAPLHPLL